MGLREELINLQTEDVRVALVGQLKSDTPPGMAIPERINWYSERLADYPSLQRAFELVVQTALEAEEYPDDLKNATIAGAGIAYLSVKAVANHQIFNGLETPPDLA
jgi:hypothetical protein